MLSCSRLLQLDFLMEMKGYTHTTNKQRNNYVYIVLLGKTKKVGELASKKTPVFYYVSVVGNFLRSDLENDIIAEEGYLRNFYLYNKY